MAWRPFILIHRYTFPLCGKKKISPDKKSEKTQNFIQRQPRKKMRNKKFNFVYFNVDRWSAAALQWIMFAQGLDIIKVDLEPKLPNQQIIFPGKRLLPILQQRSMAFFKDTMPLKTFTTCVHPSIKSINQSKCASMWCRVPTHHACEKHWPFN